MCRLCRGLLQRNRPILIAWCALLLAAFSLSPTRGTAGDSFVYPAEWQPHQAIWIGFRTRAEGLAHETVLKQMFTALAPQVRIKLVVEDERLFPEGNDYFRSLGSKLSP